MLSPYPLPLSLLPTALVRTCTKYSPLTPLSIAHIPGSRPVPSTLPLPLSLLPTALGQDLYQVLSPYPLPLSLLPTALGQDLYQVLSPYPSLSIAHSPGSGPVPSTLPLPPSLYCPQPWVRTCTKFSPLTPLSLLPTALGQDLYQVLSPYPPLSIAHSPGSGPVPSALPLPLSLLPTALGQDLYQVLSPYPSLYCPQPWVRTCTKCSPLTTYPSLYCS